MTVDLCIDLHHQRTVEIRVLTRVDMEALVGNTIARILADKGYRGHNAPPDYKFRVFLSGQKRGVTPQIMRQLRRRSGIEPVILHLKAEHRMGRNYLWLCRGDAANAVLATAGYNFRRLIRWFRILLCRILGDLLAEPSSIQSEIRVLHGRPKSVRRVANLHRTNIFLQQICTTWQLSHCSYLAEKGFRARNRRRDEQVFRRFQNASTNCSMALPTASGLSSWIEWPAS
jgi:hypothetical protein